LLPYLERSVLAPTTAKELEARKASMRSASERGAADMRIPQDRVEVRDYFAGTLQLLTPGRLQTGQKPVSPLRSGARPR
jgi:hypothetical protein